MGGIRYNNQVLNQRGTPTFFQDVFANRPAAGVTGRIFISTDTFVVQRDTGAAWQNIGGTFTGSGVIGQVAFFDTTSSVTGNNSFFWDNTNARLGINTNTPGVRLDVHGAGVIQQLNGTGTNNSYLDFQNAGSTQWRIGNSYLAGTNRLDFFNAAGTLNVFTILQNGSVGIGLGTGTPSNSYAISTNGDSTTNTGGIAIRRSGTDVMYMGNISGTNTVDFEFFNPRNGFIRWGTNNIVGMTLSNNQFLGIGYTNPNIALSVSGSIYQGSNTANANFQMFCSGNLYTGGLSPNFNTYTANVSITNINTGLCFKTAASITATLPLASGINNIFYIVVLSGTTVTLNRSGSDVIITSAGASVTSLTLIGHSTNMFYSDGGTTFYQIA